MAKTLSCLDRLPNSEVAFSQRAAIGCAEAAVTAVSERAESPPELEHISSTDWIQRLGTDVRPVVTLSGTPLVVSGRSPTDPLSLRGRLQDLRLALQVR
jgi:hypothetical protein